MEGEGEGEGVGLGLGVRKGAWTKEEDNLLKKCIEQYGEGKWYLVPSRAGLNRCRKSCRLRWLNYLKPNIKRGEFAADEVDLIIRLHNLLGNRWSLIAGRLPGRTANDVKNYWNTHFLKKSNSTKSKRFNSKPNLNPSNPNSSIVIKPRPRRLSRKSFPLEDENNNNDHNKNNNDDEIGDQVAVAEGNLEDNLNCGDRFGEVTWWEVLLMEDGNEVDDNIEHQSVNGCHINDDINQSGLGGVIEDHNNYYNWDVDLWNDFNYEPLYPV